MSNSSKSLAKFSTWLDKLRSSEPNELGPGKPRPGSSQSIERFREAVGQRTQPNEIPYAEAAVAAWTLHEDCLDEAHEISQELKSDLGSYIHGIVHRREPDYGNARYWFRQVGPLPFYAELQQAARAELAEFRDQATADAVMSADTWRPTAFVDLCEQAARGSRPLQDACRRLQQRELELLFALCLGQLEN
jgi:hypothetical protein